MHIQDYDLQVIDHVRDGETAELLSALSRHLLEWWTGFKGGKPGYRDFDIADHLSLADNIFLVQVCSPTRFEIRLCGEAVSEVIGTNNMGRVISTMGPQNDSDGREYVRLAHYYQTIVETGRCHICLGQLVNRYDLVKRFESVDCPLFARDGTVSHIIGVLVPIPVVPPKRHLVMDQHVL